MHRALRSLVILAALFCSSLLQAAEPSLCVDQGTIETLGCFAKEKFYVYDSVFGGRDADGTDLVSVDEATSITLPAGYYEGKYATWSTPNLVQGNLRKDISVFGVVGILDENATSACPTDGSTTPASCNVSSGEYAYTTAYGGRSQACVLSGNATNGACWMTTSTVSVRTEETPANCFASGQVQKTCMVSSGSYWYTTAYGGRNTLCTEGINNTKCWLPVESATANVSNLCNEDATNAGLNNNSCKTLGTNRYVYSTDKGGRGTDCNTDNGGYCWINGTNKSSVESDLVAGNIKKNVNIFGVIGTYEGLPYQWGSGAHREKSSGAANRMTYNAESVLTPATNLASDYNPVPKISSSTDGFGQSSVVTPVNRATWSTTSCGTTGPLADRITDCTTTLGAETTWEGEKNGNAGQTTWKLVTRVWNAGDARAYEVWKDTATGLLWSSLVSGTGLNWCKSSGSSNSSAVTEELRDEDPADICDNSLYQVNGAGSPVSACYEAASFAITNTKQAGKGGLTKSSTPVVAWRLPTIHDYMLANHHGLRFVLPDIATSGEEWSATVYSKNRSLAWTFDGATGARQTRARNYAIAARCVGR